MRYFLALPLAALLTLVGCSTPDTTGVPLIYQYTERTTPTGVRVHTSPDYLPTLVQVEEVFRDADVARIHLQLPLKTTPNEAGLSATQKLSKRERGDYFEPDRAYTTSDWQVLRLPLIKTSLIGVETLNNGAPMPYPTQTRRRVSVLFMPFVGPDPGKKD